MILSLLFQQEQREIFSIYSSREKDYQEHLDILDALTKRDADLAQKRMRMHLDGVRDVLMRWYPEKTPIA